MPTASALRRFRFAPILTATVLTVLLLWLLGTSAQIFLLLFIALLFSQFLAALTGQLHQRLRLPPRVAFTAAVLGTFAGIGLLVWVLVPPVLTQTKQLVTVLPDYISGWEDAIDRLAARFPSLHDVWHPGQHQVIRAVYDQIAGTFGDIVPRVFGVFHAAIDVFSVIVMGIYLTLRPGLYREWLIALFPPVHRDLVRDVTTDLGDSLRAYIVGQLFTMSLLAVLTALGLYLLNVPYWLTFGVFTGVVAIVPFFGSLLATLLPALFVLAGPNGGTRALEVVGLGVLIHLLEGNVISPLVMQKKVDLPPVLTIMAVLIVGKLLGGLGLLIAVPLLAAIMIVVRRILISRIYEGHGFRRTTRDRPLVLRVPAPEGGVLVPPGPPPDVISLAEHAEARHAA